MAIPGFDILASLATALVAALRGRSSDPLTLDLLRSDLSHESSAKIARLVATRAEWDRGRYRPEDPEDVNRILRELQRIALCHARLTALWLGEFVRLIRVLERIRAVRRIVRSVARGRALSLRSMGRLEHELEHLRRDFQALVSSLSDHFGARVRELVRHATDEIRRDASGAFDLHGVEIVLEDTGRGVGAWVPRHDRAFWADLLRNVIRNAVEATREKPREHRERGVVTVRVLPALGEGGTLVEVLDCGVGMDPEAMEGLWTAGMGRHGAKRGHGLTESKRAFAEARASIFVESARDVGTKFRIVFPFRDVPIPPVPIYRVRPALVLALGLAALTVLTASWQRQPRLVRISLPTPTSIRAFDENGTTWLREFGQAVMENSAAAEIGPQELRQRLVEHLIVRDPRGRTLGVVIGTMPGDGPGRVWFLKPRGGVRRSRVLRWAVPLGQDLGNLKPIWQQSASWPGLDHPVVAVNLRDSDHTWTSTQFFTLGGDSLAAYYHYGHLNFRLAEDLDRDGRTEILLFGINNHASGDSTFLPRPQDAYIDCLVLLEAPEVNGQSYPYTGWADLPRASEEGYLLISPLLPELRPQLVRIDVGARREGGVSHIEVAVDDGRIYHLDEHLRPYRCRVGDGTEAARLAPIRPVAPLAYFHYGVREAIDLLVER